MPRTVAACGQVSVAVVGIGPDATFRVVGGEQAAGQIVGEAPALGSLAHRAEPPGAIVDIGGRAQGEIFLCAKAGAGRLLHAGQQ